jgi:hypothetical protein
MQNTLFIFHFMLAFIIFSICSSILRHVHSWNMFLLILISMSELMELCTSTSIRCRPTIRHASEPKFADFLRQPLTSANFLRCTRTIKTVCLPQSSSNFFLSNIPSKQSVIGYLPQLLSSKSSAIMSVSPAINSRQDNNLMPVLLFLQTSLSEA